MNNSPVKTSDDTQVAAAPVRCLSEYPACLFDAAAAAFQYVHCFDSASLSRHPWESVHAVDVCSSQSTAAGDSSPTLRRYTSWAPPRPEEESPPTGAGHGTGYRWHLLRRMMTERRRIGRARAGWSGRTTSVAGCSVSCPILLWSWQRWIWQVWRARDPCDSWSEKREN